MPAAWGVLALIAGYVLDRPVLGLLDVLPLGAGEEILTGLLALVLLSAALTLVVLARTRTRVLRLRAAAQDDLPVTRTAWDRLIDRLAPDVVLVNSFPRLTLVTELLQLTGQERVWIRLATLGDPGLDDGRLPRRDGTPRLPGRP